MLFNSPEFLFVYLPIVLFGYALLERWGRNAVVVWLAAASIIFYAYWRFDFVILLLASVACNYVCARAIWHYRERPRTQSALLSIGIVANLALLGFFKYLFPFVHFIESHLGMAASQANIILPLGISFFTFTQIAYLVDLSQEEAEPQDLAGYVLFVTFFPHLIAGPILHHREIMPQFATGRDFKLKLDDVALGLTWFTFGLCKKVLIADRFAPYADSAFGHPHDLGLAGAWIGVLNYALQLYFDFSGYSDMAIGLARIFSIEFPFNFNSPYKSTNIIDFWSRWHMTLTRYLTMYIYNPLSMRAHRIRSARSKPVSRKAQRTFWGFAGLVAFPTSVTMFLAGLWHGAGSQFVIFGILHGTYLTTNHAWRIFGKEHSVIGRILKWSPAGVALTFLAVLVGQIFFRSTSTSDAFGMLGALSGMHALGLDELKSAPAHTFLFLFALPVIWLMPNTQEILGQAAGRKVTALTARMTPVWKPSFLWAGGLGCMLTAVLWYMTDTGSFLYFQF